MTSNPANVRIEMNKNFMHINEGPLNDPENAKFKERVIKVVKSDRKSAISDNDTKEFQSNYMTYNLANETTLTYMLVPLMMKASFSAPDVDDNGNPISEAKVRWFFDQGVVASCNQLFKPYRLPHALMNVPTLPAKMVKDHYDKCDALTTPKPDFSYGIERNKLPQPPLNVVVSAETEELLDVAPQRDVFFNWENKCGQGDLNVCENQAAKDSAAVILASRKLLERTGRPMKAGIDEDTYTYAATNDNKVLEIFVAYAWVPPDLSHVRFHMDSICRVPFTMADVRDQPNTLANLRKPLHNIIEWGSVSRMGALRKRYEALWAFEAEAFARLVDEKAKDEEGKSAKRKKGPF
ncbi:MAG: hypothetical protein Q9219_006545 [cf. Caloplaca sp. 3 TL-2023]